MKVGGICLSLTAFLIKLRSLYQTSLHPKCCCWPLCVVAHPFAHFFDCGGWFNSFWSFFDLCNGELHSAMLTSTLERFRASCKVKGQFPLGLGRSVETVVASRQESSGPRPQAPRNGPRTAWARTSWNRVPRCLMRPRNSPTHPGTRSRSRRNRRLR